MTKYTHKEPLINGKGDVSSFLGENSKIVFPVVIEEGNLKVGKNCFINANCRFEDFAEIKIGNNVGIGAGCSFHTCGHPCNPLTLDEWVDLKEPITIEDDVWVGANVTVLGNVRIGKGAIVGAGSVITKNVPAGVVVTGNPAKYIETATEYKEKKALEVALNFLKKEFPDKEHYIVHKITSYMVNYGATIKAKVAYKDGKVAACGFVALFLNKKRYDSHHRYQAEILGLTADQCLEDEEKVLDDLEEILIKEAVDYDITEVYINKSDNIMVYDEALGRFKPADEDGNKRMISINKIVIK